MKYISTLILFILLSFISNAQNLKKNILKETIGSPIKIPNLEISEKDFPNTMNWEDAKKACQSLGNGWRLPRKDELNLLYQNKYKIGGFANSAYWSSTGDWAYALIQYFGNGLEDYYRKEDGKFNVRAVRDFKIEALTKNILKETIGSPIKIGNLEISEKDFPKVMNWEDAKKACQSLGNGWRLPNKDELNLLYQNKYKIGGFTNYKHWSSTESVKGYAWFQHFYDGLQIQNDAPKNYEFDVRAVRGFIVALTKNILKETIGSPIKIGNLEISEKDFPIHLNWEDAKKACQSLGNGWRLPNKDELNLLYQNKYKIGGFTNYCYWSSTEYNSYDAWRQYFSTGIQDYDYETSLYYVRAVRAF